MYNFTWQFWGHLRRGFGWLQYGPIILLQLWQLNRRICARRRHHRSGYVFNNISGTRRWNQHLSTADGRCGGCFDAEIQSNNKYRGIFSPGYIQSKECCHQSRQWFTESILQLQRRCTDSDTSKSCCASKCCRRTFNAFLTLIKRVNFWPQLGVVSTLHL